MKNIQIIALVSLFLGAQMYSMNVTLTSAKLRARVAETHIDSLESDVARRLEDASYSEHKQTLNEVLDKISVFRTAKQGFDNEIESMKENPHPNMEALSRFFNELVQAKHAAFDVDRKISPL